VVADPAESVTGAAVSAQAPAAVARRARVRSEVEPMQFLWPHNLWWMLALPVVVVLYLRWARRGARRPAPLPLRIGASAGLRPWQRHLPPALILLAWSLLLLALSRPMAPLTLPWAKSTILLAMDISRSMRVADVAPTRMVAAQEAAKAFLREVPPHVEVGLVTFAGTAQVAQPATLDRAAVVAAIDAIQMQLGTAIGNAIVVCLAELFPDHGIDLAATGAARRASTRSRPRRWLPTAACASTSSASAPPTATPRWATAWRCTCSSTNRRCAKSRA
jgi:Ca-activated chloride channel family protein